MPRWIALLPPKKTKDTGCPVALNSTCTVFTEPAHSPHSFIIFTYSQSADERISVLQFTSERVALSRPSPSNNGNGGASWGSITLVSFGFKLGAETKGAATCLHDSLRHRSHSIWAGVDSTQISYIYNLYYYILLQHILYIFDGHCTWLHDGICNQTLSSTQSKRLMA